MKKLRCLYLYNDLFWIWVTGWGMIWAWQFLLAGAIPGVELSCEVSGVNTLGNWKNKYFNPEW